MARCLILVFILLLPLHGMSAEKMRVSHTYIGGAVLPLWIPKEERIYDRQGLEVELIWIQGNPAVAALVSGQIDLLYGIPHNAISAVAGGADLVFIGSIYNRMQYRIVAQSGIERVEQLKGKLLGIARIHDVSHFYVRLALERFGMHPDQDVKVIATGGQNDQVLALRSGRVAATIVNPANALLLEKLGFRTVLDLETLGFPVIGNVLAIRRSGLQQRRAVVSRFLSAVLGGIKRIHGDPEASKNVLAKYLRLTDRDVIEENYRFDSGQFLESVPTVLLEGLRYAIESLIPTVPAAKALRAESLVDPTVLEEAMKRGY
jgi:ABC-type nitrate/sulfonate/bicarbonate transport system substrate-binding protein